MCVQLRLSVRARGALSPPVHKFMYKAILSNKTKENAIHELCLCTAEAHGAGWVALFGRICSSAQGGVTAYPK